MIFSISGKKGSGKDTVGKIMQILLNSPHLSNEGVQTFLRKEVNSDNFYYKDNWQIKKFADKLKDIVCLLIGCNREQLENEEFKSTPLGEEWWCWKLEREGGYSTILLPYSQSTGTENFELVKMTPRLMLQLLGTECGRQIIHPQIWVNSLMADYKALNHNNIGQNTGVADYSDADFPNWIITDMRFPNEMKAVEDRNGICIRVERKFITTILNDGQRLTVARGIMTGEEDLFLKPQHESEIALDDADFQYTIDNNGTIDELIDKVRRILQAEFVEMKFYNN